MHKFFYIVLLIAAFSYLQARPQSGLVSHVGYIGSGDLRLKQMATTVAKALYKNEEAIASSGPLDTVTDEAGRSFFRFKVDDNGDCFPYAIGTTRSVILKLLENFIDQVQKSSATSSLQLLSQFSPVFSFMHKHPAIITLEDLESIFSYDFLMLKKHIEQLSKFSSSKYLEEKFSHLEKIFLDIKKGEHASSLNKLAILKQEIDKLEESEKNEAQLQNLKKERRALRKITLQERFRDVEKYINEFQISLKTTFSDIYNLFRYRKFLSILAVALNKKSLTAKFTKEVSAMKRDLEKGILKEEAFAVLKKLTCAAYAQNKEVMIGDTQISSQNSWFDLELLTILEDSLNLDCVVIVDKSNEEDARTNKIRTKTIRPFTTEPRYIYYTKGNHFDLLVPFFNTHPFPSPIKVYIPSL